MIVSDEWIGTAWSVSTSQGHTGKQVDIMAGNEKEIPALEGDLKSDSWEWIA